MYITMRFTILTKFRIFSYNFDLFLARASKFINSVPDRFDIDHGCGCEIPIRGTSPKVNNYINFSVAPGVRAHEKQLGFGAFQSTISLFLELFAYILYIVYDRKVFIIPSERNCLLPILVELCLGPKAIIPISLWWCGSIGWISASRSGYIESTRMGETVYGGHV